MAVEGTHLGKLDDEARKRRKAKNARNASRRGSSSPMGCYAIAVERGDKDGCGHRGHGFKPRRQV